MKKLFGVTVPIITPLDANDQLNEPALRQLTHFLIEKGVDCLYPAGTTGEMLRLATAERKKMAEIIVEEAEGRVPVFIHIGAMALKDTLELAEHAYEIGADGIGAVTPCYFSVNDREMEEYYVSIAQAVPEDFPLYLYNIPQCAANDLQPDVIQKIVDRCPNVIGIKYSFADMSRTLAYLAINQGNFEVIHGADYLFHSLLMMGCAGTVSGVAGVYPEPFVEVYKDFKAGDRERAMKYQKIATAFNHALKGGSNMAYFKAALQMRGIDAGYMRKPQLDLGQEEKEALREELAVLEKML